MIEFLCIFKRLLSIDVLGVAPVKKMFILGLLYFSTGISYAIAQDKPDTSDGYSMRFTLPVPKTFDWLKPVKCTAIASTFLAEQTLENKDFKEPKLTAKVGKGTDNLNLWLEGNFLILQSGNEKPDRYQVVGHRNKWLIAVYHGGEMPVAKSITLDESSGFTVWSLSEPMLFPGSEYPCASTVYLQCTN